MAPDIADKLIETEGGHCICRLRPWEMPEKKVCSLSSAVEVLSDVTNNPLVQIQSLPQKNLAPWKRANVGNEGWRRACWPGLGRPI